MALLAAIVEWSLRHRAIVLLVSTVLIVSAETFRSADTKPANLNKRASLPPLEFAGFTPDGEVVTATSEGVVEFRAMEAWTTPNRIDCLPRYASHQRGWMLPRLGN